MLHENEPLPEVRLVFGNRVLPVRREIARSSCAEPSFRWLFHEHMDVFESFAVMMLGHGRRPRAIYRVSSGGLTETVVDVRMVFGAALKSLCTGLILAHNHPSGVAQPSAADIALTKRMAAIGDLMDIEVVDHLILTRDGYFSFVDAGLM